MHQQSSGQEDKGGDYSRLIGLAPGAEIEREARYNEKSRQPPRPRVGYVLHEDGVHREKKNQRQYARPSSARHCRQQQTTCEEYEQVQKRENNLKEFESVLSLRQEIGAENIHHRRPGRKRIRIGKGRVCGQSLKEK